jgi:hypothetical protein
MSIRIFRHYVQLPVVLLILIEAGLAVIALQFARILELTTIFATPPGSAPPHELVIFAGLVTLAQAAMGLHNARLRAGPAGILLRLALAAATAFAAVLAMAWMFPVFAMSMPRSMLALAIVVVANFRVPDRRLPSHRRRYAGRSRCPDAGTRTTAGALRSARCR